VGTDKPIDFGDYLDELLHETSRRRVTHKELGNALGVTGARVEQWLSGRDTPDPEKDHVDAIVRYLELTPGQARRLKTAYAYSRLTPKVKELKPHSFPQRELWLFALTLTLSVVAAIVAIRLAQPSVSPRPRPISVQAPSITAGPVTMPVASTPTAAPQGSYPVPSSPTVLPPESTFAANQTGRDLQAGQIGGGTAGISFLATLVAPDDATSVRGIASYNESTTSMELYVAVFDDAVNTSLELSVFIDGRQYGILKYDGMTLTTSAHQGHYIFLTSSSNIIPPIHQGTSVVVRDSNGTIVAYGLLQ
jgi:hypothetical protein